MLKSFPNNKVFTDPVTAVDNYKKYYSLHWTQVKEYYRDVFESGISDYSKAVAAIYGPHQKRIAKETLEKLSVLIEKAKPWEDTFQDFEELYSAIGKIVAGFNGLVTKYDISLRLGLGVNPRVLPEDYVYLTSSTVRNNGSILLGVDRLRGVVRKKSDFPKWIQSLSAMEIEDFLCHVELVLLSDGLKIYVPPFLNKYSNFYPESVEDEIVTIKGGKYKRKTHPIY